MSFLRRLFDSRHRRALAAEGAGHWRRAASLWMEAGEEERAASALIHLAERDGPFEERLLAWQDALRWLPPEDEERKDEIEERMALFVLEDAQHRGALGGPETRRLADAATRLERLERPKEAAVAYRLLARPDDEARALEAAGDVEALERLLEQTTASEGRVRKLRRLVSDHDMAMKYGDRVEALTAIREAARLAPDDRSVDQLRRRLEGRLPRNARVSLRVDGVRLAVVGRLPAVLGRADADVVIRGTSVSRRHCEIRRVDDGLEVRDLDSRNGTLVRGLPITGPLRLSGETELGLGDDVQVAVRPLGPRAVQLTVRSGRDRGLTVVLGPPPLRPEGLPAVLRFPDGWAQLEADPGVELTVDDQPCALPLQLLHGDRLAVGEHRVEVEE